MNETVDILLATYQGASYVKEQLQSILNQSYQNFRILIRDDGSSDQTLSIVESFRCMHPNRIFLLPSHERLGVKGNFSALMKQTQAPYVMFCDQDDYWLPNKIEVSLQKIKEMERKFGSHIPLLVHTNLQVVATDLALIHPSFWKYSSLDPSLIHLNRLLLQNVVTGCTMMMNKTLIELSHPIPKQAMMHDWWIALVATIFGKIEHIHTPTILYRQHGHNDTGAKKYSLLTYLQRRFSKKYIDFTPYTYQQAQILLERYDLLLNASQQNMIRAYCCLQDLPYLKRKKTLIHYQFFKQGFLRNLYLLIKWS